MPSRVLTVDEIMAILPTTVPRITELTDGLTAAELRAVPEPGAWSASDVLAHLRACHDVLGGSMLRILAEDRPRWRRLSPRTWMRKTDYPDWEFGAALAAFTAQRDELLAALERRPATAWERVAIVAEDGGPTERSMAYYGDWMAGHERDHMIQIQQIAEAVTTQMPNDFEEPS
jgi:DinB superfamily